MDQSITLWSIFKLRGGIVMKLIFKDGQELVITRANDTYSYEGYKDGLGNDMNKNIVATISIFNSDKSLNTIKDMITDENRTGFKIIYGNTQKDYTGMKIESISEEISNERSVINISLATDKTIAPTETTETTTEKTKEETKEKKRKQLLINN